jgi:hypothetical protein
MFNAEVVVVDGGDVTVVVSVVVVVVGDAKVVVSVVVAVVGDAKVVVTTRVVLEILVPVEAAQSEAGIILKRTGLHPKGRVPLKIVIITPERLQ